MVRIVYLKYDQEYQIAYYTCFPEGKENDMFELGINPVTMEIVSNSLQKNNSYSAHAAWRLFDIIKETHKLPKEATAMWV